MKKLTALLCLLSLFFLGKAQLNIFKMNEGVKFNELTHDFGNVKEENENVSTVFSFTNISDQPLFIVKVETSCGCTTPEYSKDTIQPGNSGFVKAIFATRGRSGNFHKNLYVHFNKENYYQSLIITGFVIAQESLANMPKSFTTTYSNLAWNSTMAEFPNLINTEIQTYQIKAYNFMNYPIRIYEVSELPGYLSLDIGDSLIDVSDSIIITVKVDGRKVGLMGASHRRIGLLTDDPSEGLKFIHVYTNLKQDFSKMSKKELKNAPILTLDTKNPIELGNHSAGEKFNKVVTITNSGKSTLDILSVVPNCSCISFNMGKTKLEPGESAQLVLIIDTVNQSIAEHKKYVTITSNDPKQSEINIKILINITN